MTHYIIVKFLDTITDKKELPDKIRELFRPAEEIPGIHQISVIPSCIDRDNRHDLMIRMEMESEALERFDASEIHREWKERYGNCLAAKTIFDCE